MCTDRLFECPSSHFKFKTKVELVNHTRIHTEEKPYPCPKCDKSVVQIGSLLSHKKRLHSDNLMKPYKCNMCSASFLQKYELNKHLLVHDDVKPHKCSYCGVRFKNKKKSRGAFEKPHRRKLLSML